MKSKLGYLDGLDTNENVICELKIDFERISKLDEIYCIESSEKISFDHYLCRVCIYQSMVDNRPLVELILSPDLDCF